MRRLRGSFVALMLLGWAAGLNAEVLVRWEQDDVPPVRTLGVTSLVVPAANGAAIRSALAGGYRVFLEVEAARLAGFVPSAHIAGIVVKGGAPAGQLRALRARLKERGGRVSVLQEGARWPHIRSNWVTKNNEVLQVSGRTAQPWIENNAALLRIARAAVPETTPLLSYAWQPITAAELDAGPQLENYLVAIAEAGSFGGDLVLPLHETLQKGLLLGRPAARAAWEEIRRHVDFYRWNLPARYEPVANIGVIATDPMPSYELLNLLSRHNLAFTMLDPGQLAAADLAPFDLVIALDTPEGPQVDLFAAFAQNGGVVLLDRPQPASFPWRRGSRVVDTDRRVGYSVGEGRVVEAPNGFGDPNAFALEVRQLLGPGRRPVDIWNGITVLAASYQEPGGANLLLTAVNYAHQPLPVQLRVRGIFSQVQYESPEDAMARLPFEHRDGCTEFLIPALRVGGRVFLSRDAPSR